MGGRPVDAAGGEDRVFLVAARRMNVAVGLNPRYATHPPDPVALATIDNNITQQIAPVEIDLRATDHSSLGDGREMFGDIIPWVKTHGYNQASLRDERGWDLVPWVEPRG